MPDVGGPECVAPPLGSRLFAALVLAAAASIVAGQLFLPPPVGLADDGDFAKIMGPVGLQYPTPADRSRYYSFLTLTYRIVPPWWKSGYVTSEAAIVAFARRCAASIFRTGVFDIRVLGLIHSILFLAGFALLLAGSLRWPAPSRIVFALCLLFVFTDVGYAALFQAMYGAAASFLSLFLLAGVVLCLADGRRSAALSAAYWIAAVGLVVSKPQESALAPLLALLAYLLAREGRGPGTRRGAALLGIALTGAGAFYYFQTPRYLKTEALYNDLFLQMLHFSPDPTADLAELGLPSGWTAYSGTFAYLPTAPIRDAAFRAEFERRVGYRKILGLYLRHPQRLRQLLGSAAQNAFRLRQSYLGNFPESAGGKPGQRTHSFASWSRWKSRLRLAGPWLLPAFWIANLAICVSVLRRSEERTSRCLATAAGVLVALSLVEFLVCAFGDALADVARHLHAFNAMTDLLIVSDAAAIVFFAAGLGRAFRRRLAGGGATTIPRLG